MVLTWFSPFDELKIIGFVSPVSNDLNAKWTPEILAFRPQNSKVWTIKSCIAPLAFDMKLFPSVQSENDAHSIEQLRGLLDFVSINAHFVFSHNLYGSYVDGRSGFVLCGTTNRPDEISVTGNDIAFWSKIRSQTRPHPEAFLPWRNTNQGWYVMLKESGGDNDSLVLERKKINNGGFHGLVRKTTTRAVCGEITKTNCIPDETLKHLEAFTKDPCRHVIPTVSFNHQGLPPKLVSWSHWCAGGEPLQHPTSPYPEGPLSDIRRGLGGVALAQSVRGYHPPRHQRGEHFHRHFQRKIHRSDRRRRRCPPPQGV